MVEKAAEEQKAAIELRKREAAASEKVSKERARQAAMNQHANR